MKSAGERVREWLDRWEGNFAADLDAAMVAMLTEHEADVREACARLVDARMPDILHSVREEERVKVLAGAAGAVEHVARRHWLPRDIEADLVRAARGES